MALIAWNKSYCVNVPQIDEQHKKLVSLINEMHEAMQRNEEHSATGKILNDLTDYIKVHFSMEEELMNKSGFSRLDAARKQHYDKHKKEHAAFTEKITGMNRQHNEEKSYISVDLLTYLVEWLLNHIAEIDRQCVSLLNLS